jgi:hypothetical protein
LSILKEYIIANRIKISQNTNSNYSNIMWN